MTLQQYLESYILEHDLAVNSEEQLRVAVRHFLGFLGEAITIHDLCADHVNRYIRWLQHEGRSYSTVKGRRTNLLTLWRDARLKRLNSHPVDFVRRLNADPPVPKALTETEARHLAETAETWIGHRKFRDGTDMGIYFTAYVRMAWDSGMRKGDILVLPLELVANRFWVKPSKNKRTMPIDIHETTAKWATRLSESRGGLRMPFASPTKSRTWFKHAKRLCAEAGVDATMKHLRSGCGTACAMEGGIEDASRKLGHRSSETTKRHYLPPWWNQGRVILPPEL